MGRLKFDRKVGESVMVGDNVQVVVVKISANRVVISFEAPNEVPIHRTEVWQRIRSERKADAEQAAAPRRKAS